MLFQKTEGKTKLNRIVIPDSVKVVKSFAFSGRRSQNHDFWKRHPENRRMFSL